MHNLFTLLPNYSGFPGRCDGGGGGEGGGSLPIEFCVAIWQFTENPITDIQGPISGAAGIFLGGGQIVRVPKARAY